MLLGDDKREPTRFHLVLTQEMGAGRKSSGRKPGFIDSILQLIETFHGSVVQNIAPWTPKAPRMSAPATEAASVDDDNAEDEDEDEPKGMVAPTWSPPGLPAATSAEHWLTPGQ